MEALHEAGMECFLWIFIFQGSIRPDLTLQVLRFWRREYRVDGFVLLGDGVRMEYLAKDPMLADVKFSARAAISGRFTETDCPRRNRSENITAVSRMPCAGS